MSNVHRLVVSPGGRSSVSGVTATVFGASGNYGRYVVDRLGRIGSQIVVPFRDDGMEIRHLRVLADVGQVAAVPFELRDSASIENAMSRSNVVVNLIGRFYETKNFKFADVHVEGARALAAAARKAGVERFVHVSCLGASQTSPSAFLRSKGDGEAAVLSEFPDAIIMRPAATFGWEDDFLLRYAQQMRRFKWVVVANDGKAKRQPVFVENVADAIMSALNRPEAFGQTFELGGPDVLDVRAILKVVAQDIRMDFRALPLPLPLAKAFGWMCEQNPWKPLATSDDFVQMGQDIVVDPHCTNTLQTLDILPTSLHDKARLLLSVYRSERAYIETTPF